MALWRLPKMFDPRSAIRAARNIEVREWYGLISRIKLDAIEQALEY